MHLSEDNSLGTEKLVLCLRKRRLTNLSKFRFCLKQDGFANDETTKSSQSEM